MREGQPTAAVETGGRERAIAHGEGPLLVLGAAGTGKTELLARRLARLAADGTAPERVLLIGSTRATARRLREKAEALLPGPFEELWIGSWDTIGERLLRDHAEAAGLDPFFDVLGPAERLAMLLDRLDQLPLRRHEIRGNPAGLLARLLARIDALKADRVGPTRLEQRAREAGNGADDEAGGGGRPARARVRRALHSPRPHPRRRRQPRPRRRLPRPRLPLRRTPRRPRAKSPSASNT